MKQANLERVIGTNHSNPLFLANGIVVRIEELDSNLVDSVSVIKCPQSIKTYGNLGANGVVVIKTKQAFETTRLQSEMHKSHGTKNKTIYALNGFILKDTNIEISKTAIKEIDVLSKSQIDYSNRYKGYTCFNIWTLTKNERTQLCTLCKGLKIQK